MKTIIILIIMWCATTSRSQSLTLERTNNPDVLALLWIGAQDRIFIIEYSSDLVNWDIFTEILPGYGRELEFPVYCNEPRRFYRWRESGPGCT